MENEKKVNVYKVIAITVGAVLVAAAICFAVYTFFKKYFKLSFKCGDCADCDEDCFNVDFDPELCDDDFFPKCESDGEDESEEKSAE